MWTADLQQYVGRALAVLLAGVAGFVIGYFKKKGENLATHEDINKLVDQMSAVTTATKKIEAEISSGVWDRQKRWEMKREVLFSAAKRLAEVDDAMLTYSSMRIEDDKKQKAWAVMQPSPEERVSWGEIKNKKVIRWSKASTAFDESRLFVGIVCEKDTKKAFEELVGFINILIPQIAKDPTVYQSSRAELITKILVARNAIRKELEVDPIV